MKLDINHIKKHAKLIHYFGLGFIQVKLNEKERLHFYTTKFLPIVNEEEIHNHKYNFTSKIIKGKLKQEIYDIIPGNTHIKELESCNINEKISSNPIPCSIKLNSMHNYSKDSTYTIQHDTFHKVSSHFCITLVTKEEQFKPYAEVIRKINQPKICPFSKQVPESQLLEIIEEMLIN